MQRYSFLHVLDIFFVKYMCLAMYLKEFDNRFFNKQASGSENVTVLDYDFCLLPPGFQQVFGK